MRAFASSFLLIFTAILVGVARSQPARDIREGNADYPVPIPAALYGAQSGNDPLFMEPSTVRNATFATRGVWGNNGERVAVGAEIAPLLVGDGVDLSEYLSGRLIRVLLRTRLSFAVETSGDGNFHSALGVRWMLHDDADLRADSSFQQTLNQWTSEQRAPRFDSLRAAMKEISWNRSVVEIGFAAAYRSGRAADGAAVFAVNRYNGFLSAGFPMLGRSGQIEFGASGWAGHGDDERGYERRSSVTVRSFYGSASERLFAGARLVAGNLLTPDYRLELGGVMRLGNGFWIRPDLGVSLLGRPFHGPEGSVTISFGTPEMGNL